MNDNIVLSFLTLMDHPQLEKQRHSHQHLQEYHLERQREKEDFIAIHRNMLPAYSSTNSLSAPIICLS